MSDLFTGSLIKSTCDIIIKAVPRNEGELFFGDYNGDYKNFKNFHSPQIFIEQLKKIELKIFSSLIKKLKNIFFKFASSADTFYFAELTQI